MVQRGRQMDGVGRSNTRGTKYRGVMGDIPIHGVDGQAWKGFQQVSVLGGEFLLSKFQRACHYLHQRQH